MREARHLPSVNSSSPPPTGSVMVVGGGIAGMQAALDLADQGFKVYLIESQAAIGGKMAQLDKTFPTNDCAMCTISPKLVETGRHANIEIFTRSEVQHIQGSVGNFTVQVHREPRYVDPEKCVSCGDCVQVCPVIVPDRFNEGLSDRRAIYKLYPQAVPNAFAIEKRGIAPCRDACPAGQRAQGYIALIREGRWEDALRVIKMDNPFPGICGRICNHRCETACNRGQVDEPINIRALKRFVTDKVYQSPRQPLEPFLPKFEQRVAIIGAGPCGLTAAQDLVRAGFRVTIFEAMPVAGGMLRLGVPEYRLPTEIIEREVQDILDLGVELHLNSRVDNLDDLFDEGFQAVLIAVGAHEGVRLRIPGAGLEGVLVNTHFLRDVRLGKYSNGGDPGEPAPPLGKRVLVLGGGNVAIDCARSAVRLGCEVHLACLEGRDAMPAHAWEVEAAESEGVIVHAGRTFEQILGDEHGHVTGVECMRVGSFRFDETGRLQVEKIPGTNHALACDTVIFSVGQRAGLAFIPSDAGVGITERQTIAINPNTLAATRPGVFAAGDSVSGTSFVIEAVNSGHQAAESIMRYLHAQPLEPAPKPKLPVVHLTRQEIDERLQSGEIHIQPRISMPELPVSQRIDNFQEVEGGYDDASAQAEAARCLACGICSECMSCVFACGRDAIDHNDVERTETLQVGAIILAPGYQVYRSYLSQEYGLGRFPNVVTSLQFERLLSASGPTSGHLQRPSDKATPKRIAFLQCVGSRDQQHDYCSAVCCMYATKEAMIAKEHYPELEIQVFMMDMRAFSKSYQSYFDRARQRYGVEFTRCRISSLYEDPNAHDLIVNFQDQDQMRQQSRFDLVVLSVGMEISASVKELGRRLGIELDEYGFCHTVQFNPLETTRPGIYAVGPFREPKDIPESVVEASGAAAAAAVHLSEARYSLTVQKTFPPERDVSQGPPRIGVFVCHCGSNIAGYLDVPGVTGDASHLPGVVHAESNLYTCSQDSIRHISEVILEKDLNRVVVASCTPLTHEPLFRDSLRSAGLNPYLFEMANIRNHCSWVHSHDHAAATEKARQLVQMAVAKAARLEPLHTLDFQVEKAALVVGGGISGLTAALSLADQGFPVHLVEIESQLGGNLRKVFVPAYPHLTHPGENEIGGISTQQDPQQYLERLIQMVLSHPLISLHLNSKVESTQGFKGKFSTTIQTAGGAQLSIKHGATILATGAQEYRGSEYGYGSHPNILTQQDFEALFVGQPERIEQLRSLVMIQCVGPAERSKSAGSGDPTSMPCSRICCTVALKNAIALKERNPGAQIVILYKDLRVYGKKEALYTAARQRGVIFARYDDSHPPVVESSGDTLAVRAWEMSLGTHLLIKPDLIVLSMPVVPPPGAHQLSTMFKVAIDADGFFQEAHVKLRPVDFSTEGIFMAGMAHYPKLLDESVIQAQAAASRAARVLSQETLPAGGRVAVVQADKCTGCLTCVRLCPFHAPQMRSDLTGVGGIAGAAMIEPAICQGCGSCAAECPARAIQLMHYTDVQMGAKIEALLSPGFAFVQLDQVYVPGDQTWTST